MRKIVYDMASIKLAIAKDLSNDTGVDVNPDDIGLQVASGGMQVPQVDVSAEVAI